MNYLYLHYKYVWNDDPGIIRKVSNCFMNISNYLFLKEKKMLIFFSLSILREKINISLKIKACIKIVNKIIFVTFQFFLMNNC